MKDEAILEMIVAHMKTIVNDELVEHKPWSPYYKDSLDSLERLTELAKEFAPTHVIELEQDGSDADGDNRRKTYQEMYNDHTSIFDKENRIAQERIEKDS